MKTVTFGMVWQVCAKQSIDLPDDVNADDPEEVKDYIRSQWDDIPLPGDGEYVPESDQLDELVELEISTDADLP